MTDRTQAIRDDIAFMKALAQEGRRTPLLGGPMLFAAIIYVPATVIAWAAARSLLGSGPASNWRWQLWPYWAAWAVYMAVVLAMILRKRSWPGAAAVNNRANTAAWQGLGAAACAVLLASAAAAWRLHESAVWTLAPAAVLALYGVAWNVSAAMSDQKWLKWIPLGCYAAAIVAGLMVGVPEEHLFMGAAILLLLVLPGWLLMRQQPST